MRLLNMSKQILFLWLLIAILLIYLINYFIVPNLPITASSESRIAFDYSQFLQQLQQNNVQEVIFQQERFIIIKLKDGTTAVTVTPEKSVNALKQNLIEKKIPFHEEF